jgi:hypothetical protein
MSRRATYDLEWIQHLVESGRYRITLVAATNAQSLGFDEQDIKDCVMSLDNGDLYKTMPSKTMANSMQDVYMVSYCEVPIYLKVTIAPSADAVVIQFKRNTNDES